MTKTLKISLPEGLVAELDRRARTEHRSRSEVLRAAALAYLHWWDDWQDLRAYGRRQAGRLKLTPRDVGPVVREMRARR